MRKDKATAIKMRKQAKSYNEINRLLNVPKSTLSCWFRGFEIPEKVKNKLLTQAQRKWAQNITNYNKRRALLIEKEKHKTQQTVAEDIGKLTDRELLLVGSTLYWAEGNKKDRWSIRFCNSDPAIIKIIMKFFRKICNVNENKFRAQIQIHPNISEENTKVYWSKITKIPINQFTKTQTALSKSSRFRRPSNTLPHGTLHIKVSDVNLVNRLKGWILGISKPV